MLYTHSCCFKSWITRREMLPQSGARGWYREPTKLLRPSSFIGSRPTNRNRFPGDFNLSVVPVFRCGGTLNLQGHLHLSWKSKFLYCKLRDAGTVFAFCGNNVDAQPSAC